MKPGKANQEALFLGVSALGPASVSCLDLLS